MNTEEVPKVVSDEILHFVDTPDTPSQQRPSQNSQQPFTHNDKLSQDTASDWTTDEDEDDDAYISICWSSDEDTSSD